MIHDLLIGTAFVLLVMAIGALIRGEEGRFFRGFWWLLWWILLTLLAIPGVLLGMVYELAIGLTILGWKFGRGVIKKWYVRVLFQEEG